MEMTMATMTATIEVIQPSSGKGPSQLFYDGGVVKCWDDVGRFLQGRTYEFPYYEKDYQGTAERYVGKGIVKEVSGGNAPQTPVAAPQTPVAPNGGGTPQTTPMAVANAPQGNRERSIQAQAIIKSVIAVGGTEADVQRWMDCHDKIVSGDRVG
tara:strand:+ start:312 stop:773 length:462 start_codon:yes stop_codon:yes gene_type:complete